MALIICKECKAQVSDKATCCPKCGAAIVVKSPKYYIWKNKQQMGPFSLDALKGQIEPKTLVWTKSQKQWVKAIELPELRPLLQSQEQTQPNSQVQPVQPSPSPEVKPAQSTPQPQPVEQPQKESSESQENEMEDDIEQKSNKGLILGFLLGFVALIVVAVLCIPQLRFWEDINKGDLLETAYNEGYNCGKQFGNMNRCEELFDVACRTYITDKNKDSEFYKEFQQQFTQGMEAGVKDSPYKDRDSTIRRLCKEKVRPKDSPYKGQDNSYGGSVVDLGLSVLWCDNDFRATNSNEASDYFTFDEATSALCSMSGGWRLPTKDELEELKNRCKWTWTGSGYRVTGLNGNSIYLPASGFSRNSSVKYKGSLGRFWSSTGGTDNKAGLLIFNKSQIDVVMYYKDYGFSVRLVRQK